MAPSLPDLELIVRARPALSLLAAGTALVGLTGCERPAPGVTVVSGTESVRAEATKYCFGGYEKDCVEDGSATNIAVLHVKRGEAVGFDVDKELTEKGWFLRDEDRRETSAIQDKHYLTFTPDFTNRTPAGVVRLQVVSADGISEDPKATGLWRIQLVLDS